MEVKILENVTLAYAFLMKGRKNDKYPANPAKVEITAFVDEDTAIEFEETYTQNKVKKIKTSEFEDRLKFPPPYPDQRFQYSIVFRKAVEKDGEQIPYAKWPKLYVPVNDKGDVYVSVNDKGDIKDVTMTQRIGNGSKGAIQYVEWQNDTGTTFHTLMGVRVDEMVEPPPMQERTGLGRVVGNSEPQEEPESGAF